MVKMVNRLTGSYMYVDESRVEEYKAAGHKMAVSLDAKPKAPARKRKAKK